MCFEVLSLIWSTVYFFNSSVMDWLTKNIGAVISAVAALVSIYYAVKSQDNFRFSIFPVLIPTITDVSDPHTIKIAIVNEGNGIARNISAKYLVDKILRFDTDLLPKRELSGISITWQFALPFENGNNPLFTNPELTVEYEDFLGKKHQTIVKFKKDATEARSAIGHIDVNFIGYRFV
jgi:hypothetical protein